MKPMKLQVREDHLPITLNLGVLVRTAQANTLPVPVKHPLFPPPQHRAVKPPVVRIAGERAVFARGQAPVVVLRPWKEPTGITKAEHARPGPLAFAGKRFGVQVVKGTLTNNLQTARFQGQNTRQFYIPPNRWFINVATARILIGASRRDAFLKLQDGRWIPLADDAVIDLLRAEDQYRVGRVQIYS